jgi:hypothetical protein
MRNITARLVRDSLRSPSLCDSGTWAEARRITNNESLSASAEFAPRQDPHHQWFSWSEKNEGLTLLLSPRDRQRHNRADHDRDVKLSSIEQALDETFVSRAQRADHGESENHFGQTENAKSGSAHRAHMRIELRSARARATRRSLFSVLTSA